jgi:hypothetical protein
MNRRDVALCVGAMALAACSRQQQKGETPAAEGADPADVIAPLYARYMTDPAVTTFPALEDQAPWSASMRQALVAMMARSADENEPVLDFDPFANAQDWQISNVNVTTEAVSVGSHAVVRASFLNAEAPQEVVYDLIWENGGWRVDNMRSGGPRDGWDLRQIATQP